MNQLSLFYQQPQPHKFLHNLLKRVVFLKYLRYHKMVVYFLIFDVSLVFWVF